MNTLQFDIHKTRKIYRELFVKAQEAIDFKLYALKKTSLCNHCTQNCEIDFNSITLLQTFPKTCNFRFWQEAALNELEQNISRDIFLKIQEINSKRNECSCACCGSCCNLASSEFSWDELLEKAQNGDKFAEEFTQIFIPYDSVDEARDIYPDYVSLVEKQFADDMGIHFFHCPKIGSDNLCSDYDNRPQICRDFPNNPLVVFPPVCAFRPWKDEVEITALLLHAMVEIVAFYKERLRSALNS